MSSRTWIRRNMPQSADQERMERTIRRQTAWAAGTEQFQHRDPLYHVTEAFQQSFDAAGRRHAQSLDSSADQRQDTQTVQQPSRSPDLSARSFFEQSDQDMLTRFSETAFQRGTLSGAVLRGTGRMMLFSCLKRTVGQTMPDRMQQRRLFAARAASRNVPGQSPDKVRFSKGFPYSAVALVVDALQDARQTVDSLQKLASGAAGLEGSGAETLRTMYPFLDSSREKLLLSQYREQLQSTERTEAQGAVQNAIVRLEALIAKKSQMKEDFINHLRHLSDLASEALAELEAPDFPKKLDAALRQAVGAEDGDDGAAEDGTAEQPPDGRDPSGDGTPGAKKSHTAGGTAGESTAGRRRGGAAAHRDEGAVPPDGQQRPGGVPTEPDSTA